jgi:hypothetical protein
MALSLRSRSSRPRLAIAGTLVALTAVACKPDPRRPAPATSAAPVVSSAVAVGQPAPASSAAPVPAIVAPDHWSTVARDPQTVAGFEASAPSGTTVAFALSLQSPAGEEGELLVLAEPEKAGNVRLFGQWDDTVVEGEATAGAASTQAITLRDRGTGLVIFMGRWDRARATLTGTMRAEGELRTVESLPPSAWPVAPESVQLSELRRTASLVFADGMVKKANYSFFAPRPAGKRDAPLGTRLAGDHTLVLRDDRGEWPVFATARGLLGRSPEGHLVRGSFASPTELRPLPLAADGLELRKTSLQRGRRGGKCEIDLDLPKMHGTPHDDVIDARLLRTVLDAGAGFWPSGEDKPTLASFVCQNDPTIPLQIQTAQVWARALGRGFVSVRVDGYARFSDMGGVASSSTCLLIDGRRGEVIEKVLDALPDATNELLLRAVNQRLRRNLRSQALTRDDFFVADELPSFGAGVSACLLPGRLVVLVPLGTITKAMGGSPPLTAVIPLAPLSASVPPEHPLASLFASP